MPVPTKMSDLATLAGSNSPAGGDPVAPNLDGYLRAHASLIRSTNALAATPIPAASTVNVSDATGESVVITGSATISSLGTGFDGCYRELRFDSACTLVNSSSLRLPDNQNIITQTNDVIQFRCVGSGQWRLTNQSRPGVSTKVSKSGDTMDGGLSFGGAPAPGGVNDLTRHLMLNINGYGICVTNERQNYNAPGFANHDFYVGSTLTLSVGDSVFRYKGESIWHSGNQLPLGTTATSARNALGLRGFATKNQTVSTAAPSGTPADGDMWIRYTP